MHSLITDRNLGVEIECLILQTSLSPCENIQTQLLLAQTLSNHGISATARPYSRSPIPTGCQVVVEHDSSLRGESRYAGLSWSKIEVKTAPMTYRELERVLPATLDILNYFGARVNPSCGLHVHHEFRECLDRPQVVKSLQHLWWRFHRVMYGCVAPSRQASTYCIAPSAKEAKQYDDCKTYSALCQKLYRANRYSGLNLTNLTNQERVTAEWRIHGGSTEWGKIKNWILATQRWVEQAAVRNSHYRPEPMPNTRAGLNALLVTTGLKVNSHIASKVDKELRQVGKYLLRRWKHFNVPVVDKSRHEKAAVIAAA